jgi:hypothetical protein
VGGPVQTSISGRSLTEVKLLKKLNSRREARIAKQAAHAPLGSSHGRQENEFSALASMFLLEDQRNIDDLLADLGIEDDGGRAVGKAKGKGRGDGEGGSGSGGGSSKSKGKKAKKKR